MSSIRRLNAKTIHVWFAEFSLAICLVYGLFYLASSLGLQYFVLINRGMVKQTIGGSILSGPIDTVVWSIAIFVVLVLLGPNFRVNSSKSYRSFSATALLCLLLGIAVVVCLVVFGFIGLWALVLTSGLLLGVCLVFSSGLFGVSRSVLSLRVLFGGLLLVLFVELASFVLFNVPVCFRFGRWGF